MLKADVAIVGGGIAGLAHAYEAARRGLSVVLFERHNIAQGASIRNFGMVWPIGQPPGERLQLALSSRERWLEVLRAAKLPIAGTGSLHLAYQDDEAEVIHEFTELAPDHGYQCRWMDSDTAQKLSSGARSEGLLGALYSETEVIVDPRIVTRQLPCYLTEQWDVKLRYGVPVRAIHLPLIETPDEIWHVERAIVCGGDDFISLYPDVFAQSRLFRCKLQMMRTPPQPNGWKLGPALAAGLTLRFYASFGICSSLPALQARIQAELPEYEKYGIHVMASQMPSGEVTLGDSHEYGESISIFDKPQIDDLILMYLSRFLDLPSMEISERWHGVYSKHPDLPYFWADPTPGVRIVTGLGGAGMTLSFGVAEKTWREW